MLAFEIAAWFMALVDLGLVLALIYRPWPSSTPATTTTISLTRLLIGVIELGVWTVFKLGLAIAGILNLFGFIRLVYQDLVVVLPLLGFILLLTPYSKRTAARWRTTSAVRITAVLLLLPAIVGIYATFIEPFRTQLERPVAHVSADRVGQSPVRIGILSDIQTDQVSQHEETAVDRVLAEAPDVILLPGDLWQGTPGQLQANKPRLKQLLNRLIAPGGAYFVMGNCEDPDEIRTIIEGTPVRLLINEIVRVRVRDRDLTIGGVELYPTPESARVIHTLESAPETHDIRILVSHYPDSVLRMQPHSRIDLVTAGHTHGGQIVIPGFGPPLTLSHVPRDIAAGGLHVLDGRQIYVSRGLGCERRQAPRMRFLCPPEVTLLTLNKSGD